MLLDEHSRPSSPDRVSRSSFSSIRENDNTLPQTFSRSKISSYFGTDGEEAIIDDSTPSSPAKVLNMIQTQFQPPVTHPNSKLLGYWTPADSFKGWKGIQVKGKFASKSFGDLQVLHQVFSTPPPRPAKRGQNRPGDAPIERLPTEILSKLPHSMLCVPAANTQAQPPSSTSLLWMCLPMASPDVISI
jgi:hypothetical protein